MSVEIGNLSITTPLTAEGFTTPYPHSLTSTPEPVLLSSEPEEWKLDWTYTVTEILVAVVAVIGNALTVTVFAVDRKLRRLTNYYIVALAVADFLVGVLGIPFAILTSIGLPKPLWPCLLMLSTLLVLCTTSIFCLVAVSVDRYWAILYPLRYSRVMTAKIARCKYRLCPSFWVMTCSRLFAASGHASRDVAFERASSLVLPLPLPLVSSVCSYFD
ncbi:hypothetical protein C7M84_024158 [Penaeus vannamei]|uniref:G-protein coupled receptors family 1 profile domain-containing protein n=1 Tax=Penaeus vannamei TaxID=6689 RepID=A0A423U1U9_PENVA|nr:hypothetical protein C7M84_024158 [Penaeus vannamei]